MKWDGELSEQVDCDRKTVYETVKDLTELDQRKRKSIKACALKILENNNVNLLTQLCLNKLFFA